MLEAQPDHHPGPESAKRSRKTVLVVDDDFSISGTLRAILEGEGFHVISAANGLQALGHLRSGVVPELMLIDLAMPVMDGWQLCETLAQDPGLASIPVVLLSDRPDPPEPAGVAGSVRKPIKLAALLAALERLPGWGQ
jgi:CheY-like chemotaxis protein